MRETFPLPLLPSCGARDADVTALGSTIEPDSGAQGAAGTEQPTSEAERSAS